MTAPGAPTARGRIAPIIALSLLIMSLSPQSAMGQTDPSADVALSAFLDRLMMAESGGRDEARNPRSTAVGAYQFIESTFLDLARRHFAAETAGLSPAAVLALRTNREFARRAAQLYTQENAAALTAAGLVPSWVNLRLAFLLGAGGAIRVLQAPSETSLENLVGAAVIRANPFMQRLTAAGLIARATRDIDMAPGSHPTVLATAPSPPAIKVSCDLDRPSCRRWLALAKKRVARGLPAQVARR